MARPSKFNREAAVETVMHEIWRSGYESNSVKSLSEKLGITRSSFYNAFGSREQLFKEAMMLYGKDAPNKILWEDAPGKSVKKTISHMFKVACKTRASDPEGRGCLVINSVTELCNVNDELGPFMKDVVLSNMAQFETLLQRAVSNGEIDKNTKIHDKTLALQNLLVGLNVMGKVVSNESDLWKIAKATLQGLDLFEAV